jgi:hypothetical protein
MKNSKTYAWGITLLAAFGAYIVLRRNKHSNPPSLITTDNMTTDPNLPRGYRNHNPLNIRISNNEWKGKISPSGDPAFEQFISMPYGYRAALVLMRNYINKYGCNTVQKIIERWAPPTENNTLAYIQHVCNYSGLTPDTVVNANDKDTLTKMAYAMSIIENGNTEYTRMFGLPNMEIINEGWRLI